MDELGITFSMLLHLLQDFIHIISSLLSGLYTQS